jgi:hypothetical protein
MTDCRTWDTSEAPRERAQTTAMNDELDIHAFIDITGERSRSKQHVAGIARHERGAAR